MTVAATARVFASAATSVGDWASSALVDAVLASLGSSFVEAATSIGASAASALSETTSIDLSVTWFRRNVAVIGAVTLPVLVGLFAIQVATSVLRRDPGGLGRALLGVVKATVGSVLAIAVTQSALIGTDEVCAAIASASGTTVTAAASQFLRVSWLSSAQTGPVLQMLLGLMVIVGSLLLWTVLLFRKVALLVVAVFVTVAMAGSVWDATRSWSRRWAEAVAALVLCKITIVVVFVVGASAFGQVGPTGGTAPSVPSGASGAAVVSDLPVGLVLVTMAFLSPWVTWRFLHWAGMEAAGALTGAVMSSPIPGTARMAGRLAQSVGSWVLAQAATSALSRAGGRAAAGGGRRASAPPAGGGGGSGAGGGAGAGRRPPGPGGPPGSGSPPGSGGRPGGPPPPPPSGSSGRGGWTPPNTRSRPGTP